MSSMPSLVGRSHSPSRSRREGESAPRFLAVACRFRSVSKRGPSWMSSIADRGRCHCRRNADFATRRCRHGRPLGGFRVSPDGHRRGPAVRSAIRAVQALVRYIGSPRRSRESKSFETAVNGGTDEATRRRSVVSGIRRGRVRRARADNPTAISIEEPALRRGRAARFPGRPADRGGAIASHPKRRHQYAHEASRVVGAARRRPGKANARRGAPRALTHRGHGVRADWCMASADACMDPCA